MICVFFCTFFLLLMPLYLKTDAEMLCKAVNIKGQPPGATAVLLLTRARGYKTFFMLNSIEHEIFPAHRC